jgi:hypothetical protein
MDVLPNGVFWCVVAAESARVAFDAARDTHTELATARRFFVKNPGRQMSLDAIREEVGSGANPDLRAPRGAILCYCTNDGRYVFVHKGKQETPLIDEVLSKNLLTATHFSPPNGLVVAAAPLWEHYRVCEVRHEESRTALMCLADGILHFTTRDELQAYRIVDSRETTDALLTYLRDTIRTRIEYAWDPITQEALYIENRIVRSRGPSAATLLAHRALSHLNQTPYRRSQR